MTIDRELKDMPMRKLMAVLTLVLLVLAGCSGADPDVDGSVDGGAAQGSEAAGGESETAAAGAVETVQCDIGEVDGELVLYNWTEYIDPDLVEAFREEFGVDVIEDFYPSNEEMLARVQGGGSGFDVIVPSDYMVGIMIEEGLLLPLNKEAIPNGDNVAEAFTSPPFDPDLAYSMPYQWGTTGLGLSLADTSDDPESTWGWIFDPAKAEALAGRISMLDDPREAMAAALSYLGYSINSTNEDELREAADLIAESNQRLAAFDSDQYEDLLISGETAVAHGYSGDFFAAFDENDAWDDYVYIIPEEGAVRWVDNMAILGDAPHPCTAHAFINFILDPSNGATLTNWNFYASPNAAAEEFIDPEILEDPAIYPPEDVLERLQFIENTGDSETLYTDLFTQAKS